MKFIERVLQKLGFEKNTVVIIQVIKFGFVGLSNNIIYLFIYYGLLSLHVNYLISSTLGFMISVLNAYYWNSKYVFKKMSNTGGLIKTFLSYGITFIISLGLLAFMVENMHLSKLVAPIINLVITIPINFLLNKYWTFNK